MERKFLILNTITPEGETLQLKIGKKEFVIVRIEAS